MFFILANWTRIEYGPANTKEFGTLEMSEEQFLSTLKRMENGESWSVLIKRRQLGWAGVVSGFLFFLFGILSTQVESGPFITISVGLSGIAFLGSTIAYCIESIRDQISSRRSH